MRVFNHIRKQVRQRSGQCRRKGAEPVAERILTTLIYFNSRSTIFTFLINMLLSFSSQKLSMPV